MAVPIALVTGASSGLGSEFARALAARGYRLVLVARRKDRLDALAAEFGHARALASDLAAPGAVAALMADLAAHGETVSLLVNNAGFGLAGKFAELDGRRQREMIDLNIGAVVELAHAVLPDMLARKKGMILNVASTGAFQPGPGIAVYFATKAFVLSFSEALHEEHRGTGITVTALCPGHTATEFAAVAGLVSKDAFARFAASPQSVVSAGIDGVEAGLAVVIPGLLNKAGAQGHRLLPRAVLRRIAGMIKL
ncbi:MAG: SDR family oxidoreductase [Sphingomicrobium sp.]